MSALPTFIADTDASATDQIDKGPFVPSILQPAQYADMHRARLDTGELRLCAALLEDAICCITERPVYMHENAATADKRRQLLRIKALDWIEGAEAPLTFDMVCGAFSVDSSAARERILTRYAAGELKYMRHSPVHTAPRTMGANPDPRKNRKRESNRWRNRKTRRAL